MTDLAQLPPSPPNKTGWPWTEARAPLPATLPDGSPWPKISIVTPSFNQGQYIEETIRSVLLQGYPNIEYIIIDGGSSDESVEIIKKYEPWLTYWVSEKDRGQVHAINKGLARVTGEIFNWINSDDVLCPGALAVIAAAPHADAIIGAVVNFFPDGTTELFPGSKLTWWRLVNGNRTAIFHQPGFWMRPKYIDACGGIDEVYQFCFDWDLVIRYLHRFPSTTRVPSVLVRFRLHAESKTGMYEEHFNLERRQILQKLARSSELGEVAFRCAVQQQRLEWYDAIGHLSRDGTISSLRQAGMIALGITADPKVRLTRFSLGALRRSLLQALPWP